jgi:hypothetical protein
MDYTIISALVSMGLVVSWHPLSAVTFDHETLTMTFTDNSTDSIRLPYPIFDKDVNHTWFRK